MENLYQKSLAFFAVTLPMITLYHYYAPREIMIVRLFFKRKDASRANVHIEAAHNRFKKPFMFDFFILSLIGFPLLFHVFCYLFYGITGLLFSLFYPLILFFIVWRIPLHAIIKTQ